MESIIEYTITIANFSTLQKKIALFTKIYSYIKFLAISKHLQGSFSNNTLNLPTYHSNKCSQDLYRFPESTLFHCFILNTEAILFIIIPSIPSKIVTLKTMCFHFLIHYRFFLKQNWYLLLAFFLCFFRKKSRNIQRKKYFQKLLIYCLSLPI